MTSKSFFKLILEREMKREFNANMLLHLFMNPLVASCMSLTRDLNPQSWHIGTRLQSIELPAQSLREIFI